MRRRVLREAGVLRREHQLGVFVPAVATEAGRRASSAAGSFLYGTGSFLLLVSFTLVLLNWIAGMLGDATIPALIGPLLPYAPVLFGFGAVLSIIGFVISPTVERLILLVVFAAGFLAIWLGIV